MNGIGFVSEVRGICIKNTVWYYQEFVDEFTDYVEMREFCKRFAKSSK